MKVYVPQKCFNIVSINTAIERYAPENFYFHGEMHDFWEMVYVLKGGITVSEDERVYDLAEGQVIFHRPMEFHRLWGKKGKESVLIIISFKTAGELPDVLGRGVFSLDLRLSEQLLDVYAQILSSFDVMSGIVTKSDKSNIIDENLSILKLELLLLSIVSDISPNKIQQNSVSSCNYKKIIKTMKEHIYENLSVDDLAVLCNLSTSNMKKIFKMYAGCGVNSHFNRLKILRAMELIREGYSVCEISEKFGFSSPNYFSLVFKRETGITPTQYRRNPSISIMANKN